MSRLMRFSLAALLLAMVAGSATALLYPPFPVPSNCYDPVCESLCEQELQDCIDEQIASGDPNFEECGAVWDSCIFLCQIVACP